MPEFSGVNHVALTVRDLDVSTPWYLSVFGGEKMFEMREEGFAIDYLMTSGGVTIGLHRFPSTPALDQFSEFRIGLDHLSFTCSSRSEIEAWVERLDELGVAHSGITDAPYGPVLVFRDPDNIQLEFIA